MDELEPQVLIGHTRRLETTWITFEMDDRGRLLVRSLRGFKIIEDPAEAKRILQALEDITGL